MFNHAILYPSGFGLPEPPARWADTALDMSESKGRKSARRLRATCRRGSSSAVVRQSDRWRATSAALVALRRPLIIAATPTIRTSTLGRSENLMTRTFAADRRPG